VLFQNLRERIKNLSKSKEPEIPETTVRDKAAE
jgi:hypothetical protein